MSCLLVLPWCRHLKFNSSYQHRLSLAELFWIVLQIASPILHCLRHTIPRYVFFFLFAVSTPVPSNCLRPIPSNNCTTLDLFWTFTASAYNTIFKLLFIASSAYTIYLMVSEYKPTHDPNIDTFKVQYLLGGSLVLAVLFPYEYSFSEVGSTGHRWLQTSGVWHLNSDRMGLLDMARVRRHSSATLHASTDWWGGHDHHALSFRTGYLPCTIHSQLDLQIFRQWPSRSNCCHCRYHSDDPLLRLLLDLLYEVSLFDIQSWIHASLLTHLI